MVFLEYWLFWLLGAVLIFGPAFFAKREHDWAKTFLSWYIGGPILLAVSAGVALATFQEAHVAYGVTSLVGGIMAFGLAFAWPTVRLTLGAVSLGLESACFYHAGTVDVLEAFGPAATPWVLLIGHVAFSILASVLMAMWFRGFGNEASHQDGVPDDHFSSILN